MNQEKLLTIELLKRIFGNIGAVSGNNFGKTGITTKDFLNKTIKIKNDNNETEEYKTWAGEIKTETGKYKIILTNLSEDLNNPEFILVLQNNEFILSLQLYNDNGLFLIYNNEWKQISILHQLNITAAIEYVTQLGIFWEPCDNSDEIYRFLVDVINTMG